MPLMTVPGSCRAYGSYPGRRSSSTTMNRTRRSLGMRCSAPPRLLDGPMSDCSLSPLCRDVHVADLSCHLHVTRKFVATVGAMDFQGLGKCPRNALTCLLLSLVCLSASRNEVVRLPCQTSFLVHQRSRFIARASALRRAFRSQV